MTTPTIRLAHSKRKTGATVFSYVAWPTERHGIIKDGFNTVSHDTLEEAMTEMHKRIAYDWRQVRISGGTEGKTELEIASLLSLTLSGSASAPRRVFSTPIGANFVFSLLFFFAFCLFLCE